MTQPPACLAIGAAGLLKAVERRHADDLLIPECKNGPTQTGTSRLRKFDAWVLVRAWSPVTMIGYEIKVSRADWRRDEKLADYQGLCHLLYIVAPKGVVPVEEVPDGVGLLEAVGDGTRLVTRRKASRREIELPAQLLVYILMARVVPGREHAIQSYEDGRREARRAELESWVKGKSARREMSYLVSKKIQEQFEAQERAIHEMERKVADLDDIRRRIVELGFDPQSQVQTWKVSHKLRDMAGCMPLGLPARLQRTIHDLQATHDALAALTATRQETPAL